MLIVDLLSCYTSSPAMRVSRNHDRWYGRIATVQPVMRRIATFPFMVFLADLARSVKFRRKFHSQWIPP